MDKNYGRNWANVLLLILLISFLAVLTGKIIYPHFIWGKIQIFIEAALVGGLADWFAVTALFKKPLGFPYHTALLPRKRDAFIKATLRLMEQEFLARKKVYKLIEGFNLKPYIRDYAQNSNLAAEITPKIMPVLLKKASEFDGEKLMDKIREQLVIKAKSGELAPFADKFFNCLTDGQEKNKLLDAALHYMDSYMNNPFRAEKIAKRIDNYVRSKHSGMTLTLAYATNAFNPEELGDLITDYGRELVTYCQEKEGYMYGQLLLLTEKLQIALREEVQEQSSTKILPEEVKALLQGRRVDENNLLVMLLEHPVTRFVCLKFIEIMQERLAEQSRSLADDYDKALRDNKFLATLEASLQGMLQELLADVAKDEVMQFKIEFLCKGFMQRAALGGERWLIDIAKDFLNRLGDKELNELIYPKVRKDLIWIRLNGSIVGGFLGMLFVVLESLLGH